MSTIDSDDHLQARGNSGFQEPDEVRWQQWIAEDRAAVNPGASV